MVPWRRRSEKKRGWGEEGGAKLPYGNPSVCTGPAKQLWKGDDASVKGILTLLPRQGFLLSCAVFQNTE